ncbi:MAG: hypothetical protein OXG67_03545 [bacterium]|nr:hypothetical protein [bacterium]
MEQAILAMQGITLTLIGIIVTLMLYLDRGRRADIALLRNDNAQLRRDMETGFKESRSEFKKDMETGFGESRSEFKKDMESGFGEARAENDKLRDDMNGGFKLVHNRLDKLTDVVMDLCRRVGRLEGRIEALDPKADTSQ